MFTLRKFICLNDNIDHTLYLSGSLYVYFQEVNIVIFQEVYMFKDTIDHTLYSFRKFLCLNDNIDHTL